MRASLAATLSLSAALQQWGVVKAQAGGGCADLPNVLSQVNSACCNGGLGPTAAGSSGHRRRRAQVGAGSCVLSTCTPACAQVFVGAMQSCGQSVSPMLRQIDGASTFLATCQAVLSTPPPTLVGTHWVQKQGQYLAVDPGMSHRTLNDGNGARSWGIWYTDPGNTGVRFPGIPQLERTGVAPSGWRYNPNEWWVEEHGLIMENPQPLPAGRYKVVWLNNQPPGTYSYTPTVELTVTGDSWTLGSAAGVRATLDDVTHRPCRSAKYTTPPGGGPCVPDHVPQQLFPITPGGPMPAVSGCDKLDYAVLFVSAHWE